MDVNNNFDKDLTFYRQKKFLKVLKKPFKSLIYIFFVKIFPRLSLEFLLKIKAQTSFGETIEVMLPESVSSSIYYYGFFEKDVFYYLLNYLKPKEVFLDIGAHIGYYSLFASKLIGNDGIVYSFEPMPFTFKMLMKNTESKKNIFLNQVALLDKEGWANFNNFGVTMMAMNSIARSFFYFKFKKILAQKIQVQADTLDNYCQKNNIKPNFIKMDAEGVEYKILLGGEKIIKKFTPIIVLEIGGEDDAIWAENCKNALNFLSDFKYRFFIYDQATNSIKPYIVEDNTKFHYANLLCINYK